MRRENVKIKKKKNKQKQTKKYNAYKRVRSSKTDSKSTGNNFTFQLHEP